MAERLRSGRSRVIVRLGIPLLIVTVLTLAALWRVARTPVATDEPATVAMASGQTITLAGVEVRQLTSRRTFWLGSPDEVPTFVALDREAPAELEPGRRVTVRGVIEPAPSVDEARERWGINAATARMVRERGLYLRAESLTLN